MAARFPEASPIDAVLRQAFAHSQAGRLAEAERLYRQVLALRPDFAEVHVNLGITLMLQSKLGEAAASIRQGTQLKPDYVKGYYHLGNILAFQGKLGEAEASYRQALALKRDYAEAHNNLGNVLMHQGRLDEAMASYRRVLALRPDLAEPHNNIGSILLQQDKPDEAAAALRQALAVRPDYAEAHNNLGRAFVFQGKPQEAAASFQRALTAKPNYVEAHNNLGAALAVQDKFDEAVISYHRAIALKPDYVEAHDNLGNALKGLGKLPEAEASYRKALALNPDYAEAYNHLGMILCEFGRLAEGFALYMRHAALTYRVGATRRNEPLPPHKVQHDREQHVYLTGTEADDKTLSCESLFLADGSRIAGRAINLRNTVGEIEQQWRQNRPQMVVIDRFLTDEALDKLRHFCWGSTIWRSVYSGGYLGAMPEHGFACPLLAQIAEELRTTYPAIFGKHPLLHLWAFKYDSRLSGIKLHADFAAVNVNFWITPDEANLDPESGGLIVWDTAAPLDWDFKKYNNSDKEIRDFLARKGAKPATVPYRANRAVIFDSDLFHETDRIAFKEGYLNRRINATLLYGRRETSGGASEP